jgi:hypothetical protein
VPLPAPPSPASAQRAPWARPTPMRIFPTES